MSENKIEPVAWMYWRSCVNDDGTQTAPWVQRYSKFKPQDSRINRDVTPLYTAPQRQPRWVSLTDEEKISLCKVGPIYAPDGVVTRRPLEYRNELQEVAMTAVIKAEAKLREKNGGGEYSSDTHQPRVDTHQPPSDDTALLRQALEALRLVPEKRLNEVLYWDEAQSFRAAIAALRERLK